MNVLVINPLDLPVDQRHLYSAAAALGLTFELSSVSNPLLNQIGWQRLAAYLYERGEWIPEEVMPLPSPAWQALARRLRDVQALAAFRSSFGARANSQAVNALVAILADR